MSETCKVHHPVMERDCPFCEISRLKKDALEWRDSCHHLRDEVNLLKARIAELESKS